MTTQRDIANQLATAERKGQKEAKLDTARKLLANGYDKVMIHEVTGLSAEEIASLQ